MKCCNAWLLPQGFGKRVAVDQFRLQKRGGVGLKSIRLNDGDALAAINTVTSSCSQESLPCIAGSRNQFEALASGLEVLLIGLLWKTCLPGSSYSRRTALSLACGCRRPCVSQAGAWHSAEGEQCRPAACRCFLISQHQSIQPFVCLRCNTCLLLQVGVQDGAEDEEMLLSTAGGRILRTPVLSIRASSRQARGSLVSKLQDGDAVQAITILLPSDSQ